MPSSRPRRSVLYVPGANPRALEKALGLGADAVILDLEDAVAPTEKAAARERIAALLAVPRRPDAPEVVVRLNPLAGGLGIADLAVILPAQPDGLLLPKIATAADIGAFRRAAAETAPGVTVPIWAMIETARAVADPLSIALATDGDYPLTALVLGLNDLAAETGARQVRGRAPMLPWMMGVLAAGRAGGLDVIDGVFNDLSDVAAFEAECLQALDCGFDGKSLIHPRQIEAANRAFMPNEAALAEARRIAGLFDEPRHVGLGVLAVEGRIVERLHAEAAKRLIARFEVIASRGG
ncbi:citrate lyase subunit beta / citryl-CoA lyase [Kaistia soli DSM 19436]|uniref:Citrate lyase subunit beta / citryl-CoA lyase n=1 Tax=Kaistia soli DSM 19436 TaxID=1122133 RepID=A0A1M5CD04_9HYPH|nr:CoA ester lyase [Kaistia soli]SHF52599.1 citrate lyase subunit beta / citryl-CoA lyase [Kaistia soli DSM 19436]